MLDVLLVYPPVSYSAKALDLQDDLSANHPPLGYLYLAAVLREKGYRVDVIDTSGTQTLSQIIGLIKRRQPKIVGISAVTANIRGAYQLATRIKEKVHPKPLVILGGHHVSSDPGVIKRHPCFDIGITGEAEITFAEIVGQAISKKRKNFKKIYRGEVPPNLDKLPFPARDLIDFRKFKSMPVISVLASRGCPYSCIFCSRPAISRVVRVRSPKLVVKEMIEASKMIGRNEFFFQDDTINLNRKNLLGLCREIIGSGHKFTWGAEGRFNLFDEEIAQKMAQAGCNKIMFGVEAGNERLRNKVVKKGVTDSQIRQGIRLCWQHNIEPDVFLMLGFPTETQKELEDTINFGQKFGPNMIGVHITVALPGSRLWDDLVKSGKISLRLVDDYLEGRLGEGFRKIWPKYIPEGLTLDDLLEARRRANRNFYFRPGYILRRARRDLVSWHKIKEDFIEAYSLLRHGRSHRGE